MLRSLKMYCLRVTRAERMSEARRKNTGEYLLLGSSLMIVPLLFLREPWIVTKVVLQLLWALMIAAGLLLTSSVKPHKK